MSVETSEARSHGSRYGSLFGSIRPYQRSWLSRDVIAGITLAALAIPEVMGYTKIAGTPVITGLYTISHSHGPVCYFWFLPALGLWCWRAMPPGGAIGDNYHSNLTHCHWSCSFIGLRIHHRSTQ